MDQQIHFEIHARRPGTAGFVLDSATEDRAKALETAEELLETGRAVAVKVTKEMLDPASGEFKSLSIFNKGAPEKGKAQVAAVDPGPLCVAPPDLYTIHARERIGRLLEGWLARQKATPFELLHRPDLIEKLEASGVEMQHAVQKIAVPEAQARGVGVHEVIRHFHGLIERAIERVLKDGRKKTFADLSKEDFAAGLRPAHQRSGSPVSAQRRGRRLAGRRQRLGRQGRAHPRPGRSRAGRHRGAPGPGAGLPRAGTAVGRNPRARASVWPSCSVLIWIWAPNSPRSPAWLRRKRPRR